MPSGPFIPGWLGGGAGGRAVKKSIAFCLVPWYNDAVAGSQSYIA